MKEKLVKAKDYVAKHKTKAIIAGAFIGGCVLGKATNQDLSKLFGGHVDSMKEMLQHVSKVGAKAGYLAYGENHVSVKELGELSADVLSCIPKATGDSDVVGVLMFMK